ncbi:MAG TPA: isopentenyl-diphosphate Delta-isomerase [Arachnia sp.]|nr:isopentenyl-diphosphate Delta-isomerase [Arachnia sp.]HMT86291.1 isopentenyl-diphosphate Delta-isomerase [Arachnia sp.]
MTTPERVVLVDGDGSVVGTALKSRVHSVPTPLHLGFSCYLRDESGRVLVTRRALSKLTWPGVWTNSFCGHPAPGERIRDAVIRRARQELAAELADVEGVLPDFRYRALDAGGVEENEVCPVFTARLAGPFAPRAAEVVEWAWIDPHDLAEAAARAPFVFSPWMVEQLPRLLDVGAFEGCRT